METRKENRLGTMPMGRLIASMSLPLMISMFVQALYNIVDGIYVAQLSEDALAATTLAFPIQMLMIAVATGTGVGINSLLSRRLGQKRYEEANAVASNGLFLAVCSSLVFMLFGLFLSRPFIGMFTESQNLIEMGTQYLEVCAIFSFGIFIAITAERLLQVTGKSMLSMLSQIVGAVTNIILDPILIFGRYGFPKMGIRGAAIATVIGQILSCVVALVLNARINKEIHFDFRRFKPDAKIIRGIYRVGLPTILMQSIASVMQMGMNLILEPFGSVYVAVIGIYYKLQSFVFMPVFGLIQGLVPIIGFNYGAQKGARIKQAIKYSLTTAILIMLAGTLVFQLIPHNLLLMFQAEEQMLSVGVQALRIISLNFAFAAVSIVLGCILQGIGNGIFSLFNAILRQLVVLLPAAYLLASNTGVHAVWYAFVIAEVISLFVTLVVFVRIYRKQIGPIAG